MRNLLTLIITVLSLSFTFASNSPETLISNENVEVTAEKSESVQLSVVFNTKSENLEFTTLNNIASIQIYNEDGEMEFILPVQSKSVNINKNLLSQGQSKLGFKMVGQDQTYFTDITLK